jgi:hypothetical protein
MRHKVQQAIQKFRLENPQTSGWENEEVLEAMFLIASQQDESGIRVSSPDKKKVSEPSESPQTGSMSHPF